MLSFASFSPQKPNMDAMRIVISDGEVAAAVESVRNEEISWFVWESFGGMKKHDD